MTVTCRLCFGNLSVASLNCYSQSDPLQGLGDDLHTVSFVDDVAVEIITVTDYAEVELGTSANMEVVMGESCFEGTDVSVVAEEQMVIIPEEAVEEMRAEAGDEVTLEQTESGLTNLIDRPHQCAQCGKGFLYKGGLLSHMKIHSSEMPFMCSFCGKSFKRERNMKKHERCHTRENVFSCSQCDKSFVYKATLIRHELTHSGERPFLCSDCGKGFFSHAELLKHERFHTGHKPFQCPHCEKKFTQSCYLTIHLRYHTGVRPYSCGECDKSFLSSYHLKVHQRTHSVKFT
uniref:C2H2-type domain-containing protein n=1 Tax=Myripristis murdjan TaxID=586833 RepID=A0A668AY63_9TELE